MGAEVMRVGYEITRELETIEVSHTCLACDERIGLHMVWPHHEISREEAESKRLVCESCEMLLVVAELERQIEARDILLADLARFLEYDLGGCNEPSYSYVLRLIKRIEPFAGSSEIGYKYYHGTTRR